MSWQLGALPLDGRRRLGLFAEGVTLSLSFAPPDGRPARGSFRGSLLESGGVSVEAELLFRHALGERGGVESSMLEVCTVVDAGLNYGLDELLPAVVHEELRGTFSAWGKRKCVPCLLRT